DDCLALDVAQPRQLAAERVDKLRVAGPDQESDALQTGRRRAPPGHEERQRAAHFGKRADKLSPAMRIFQRRHLGVRTLSLTRRDSSSQPRPITANERYRLFGIGRV